MNLTGGQAAALAQARRLGVLPQGGSATLSKDERKRIEERRKKEKANKKKARKK
jgi:hypothetical protein